MSKLSSAFGDTIALRTKTFTLGGHTFKVRVPLTKEMEELQERISKLDPKETKERFDKMTAVFHKEATEGVVIAEDDVIVDGRSSMELVKTIQLMENRITEYVKLLVPENGSLEDITYADIEEEWPLPVQFELVEQIVSAIQPGYKDTRKN